VIPKKDFAYTNVNINII